ICVAFMLTVQLSSWACRAPVASSPMNKSIILTMEVINNYVHDIAGNFFLILERELLRFQLAIDNGDLVGVEPKSCTFVVEGVQNDKVEVFSVEFPDSILLFVFCLEGKTYDHLTVVLALPE